MSETGFARGLIANTGSGWKPVALPASFPDRYISGVAVDPNDATGRTAYVTLSGYARHWMVGPTDPGVGHVYKTSDGGASWTDISGSAPVTSSTRRRTTSRSWATGSPSPPTSASNVSGLSGGAWTRVGSGLPNVITTDLQSRPTAACSPPRTAAGSGRSERTP